MAEIKSGSMQTLCVHNFGIGIFYFLAAFASLHLVTPPGYATAIWPAAGIALGMMLLHGPRLWPGLLLGATLVNLTNLYDPAANSGLLQALLLAASLGIGATLQALCGFWLVRTQVDLDGGMLESGAILRLLVLGGPIACLVSASWSVTSLYASGVIPPANLLYNWVTWWAGDGVGVMLTVPLIYIWFGQPREAWEARKAGVALPVIAAFSIVLVIYTVEIREHEELTEARFDQQAQALGDALDKKIQRNFEVVYSLQGLFEAADFVDRDEFKRFVYRALERNPGIHALSWNPVVSQARRADFEAAMRSRGISDFTITERNEAGELAPAGQRDFYVVVQYIEPLESNFKALGFDVFATRNRKQTLRSAHASFELTGTEPINLVQETGSQTGVLFILPVSSYPSASRQQAAAADLPSGFVVGVFRIGSLLQAAIEELSVDPVNLRLTDVDNATLPKVLASYHIGGGSLARRDAEMSAIDGLYYWQKTYNFGQRNWSLEIEAATNYLSSRHLWTLWGVFITGLMFTVALNTFLLILSGRAIIDLSRASDLAAEVAEREAIEYKLQLANERLQRIASTDELTEINNRRAIVEHGVRLAAEADRYGSCYAVLMLDIDRFKSVNDKWGHKTGDCVLKAFTDGLRDTLRDVDELGRWGGEEFMVLARESSVNRAVELAKRLVKVIGQQNFEPVGTITTSIGVAVSRAGESFDELVQRADQALYRAKENGRNRFELDPSPGISARQAGT